MERTASRVFVTWCLVVLVIFLATGPTAAATADGTGPRLPKLRAEPITGTSSLSISAERLGPSDRIELSLPTGLGEANGLEREWIRSENAPDSSMERWTFSGSNSSSTALALDMIGLEPGERGLLSLFSTDPATGDQLQAHWWLVAGKDEVFLVSAGAARVETMVRLTPAPGAPSRWQGIARDKAGRLLLRQSDPRLAEVLPWMVRQEPFVRAQSISAEAAGGSVTVSTSFNMDFTNYVCESWIGLILQVTTAPSTAVITTFDVSYTVYHSVDTSRYKSSVSRRPNGIQWLNTVSLYNGTYSGHNWHTRSLTGLPDWAGYPVNFDYVLGVCNLYAAEYAYLDQWSLTLYYNTGGGSGTVDLVADSVSTDYDTVAAGGQLGYYYEAHVSGSGSVGSGFSTGVYLSSDAGISTSDTLLQTVPESSALAAGDQFGARVFSRQVNIPGSVAPGTYWVGVLLDNSNAVAETDEGNNTASRQITVVGSSSKPNLKVSGCSVSPDHASSGGTVQLSFRTQNTGSTGAAYFSYALFISSDQSFDGSDQIVSGLDVPGGWAAGYDSGTQTVSVPLGSLADGTYYVGYMADVGNQVPETNENDNFCVAQVTVGGGGGGGGGVTHWLVPAAASLTGLNHANWKTQVSIVNPDSVSHTVNLYYVAKGTGWPGVLLSGPINLSPNQAWFSDDPLAGLRPTSGLMYVVADSPGPVVTTRTYNDVSGFGRYGQGIAAEPIGSSPAGELILPMVHSGPGQYHTNLGIVQADSGSFTVEVSIYSSGGTLLATKSYTRSGAFDQITDIFSDMGLGSTVINGAWIRVKLTSGSPAHWTTYASMIDESTGDPTYIAPVAP